MRVSALIAAATGLLVGAVLAIPYGVGAGLVTAALVGGISCLGLGLAHAFVARRPAPPLRRHLTLVAALAAGIIIASVFLAAELMFVSDHDALVVSAIVVAACLVSLRAARVATRALADDLEVIRDRLRAVGGGERAVRVEAGATSELADLAAAGNTMIRQLSEEEMRREAADRARRDLVAAVSHDLRTPLAALRLMAEAIDDGLTDEATRVRYLASMQTHVAALGAMVDELFDLSRLEAGDIRWSMENLDLAELVEEAVAAMQVEADAQRIAVSAQLAPIPRPPRGDPEKLQRVLFNLLRNAISHTPPDGSVTIRAEAVGDWVEIAVADTGPGVPAADRERLFEPFARGEEARSSDGAGLGLAISRAIIEGHRGRIWLADAEVGTTVKFVIPA